MPAGALQPLLRIARCPVSSLPGPVGTLTTRRVDDPGNMAARGADEPHVPAEQLCDAPGCVPRHNVILLCPYGIGVLANAAKINRLPLECDLARLDQVVLN